MMRPPNSYRRDSIFIVALLAAITLGLVLWFVTASVGITL